MRRLILSFISFPEIILLLLIAIFSIRPVENYDFWFHAKYGEFIVNTHTLPFTDVFSHTAYGNPAIPYEWLFQLGIYLVYKYLGSIGVQELVLFFLLGYIILFRQILANVFKIALLPRLILTFGLSLLTYDFWVERPQVVAYFLFMLVLFLVLRRVILRKRGIILAPLIFLVWSNIHASMILGLYLFFGFGGIYLWRYMQKKEKEDSTCAKDFLGIGAISFLFTLLPPLGTKVYQLLWLFWQKRDLITSSILEWSPLSRLEFQYFLYIAIIAVSCVSLLWIFLRYKEQRGGLWIYMVLLPLGFFVITGVRQTAFAMPVVLLLLIPALQSIRMKAGKQTQNIIIALFLLGSGIVLYFYRQEVPSLAKDYPADGVAFIRENLNGNMFNEYHAGGYLMYQLGPQIKTFIDGRTDMFLPQVLGEYIKLHRYAYTEDLDYLNYYKYLVDKYDVSWAIFTNQRFTVSSRLARILGDTPDWKLVYIDDTSRIFVRDDGENTAALTRFSLNDITPFGKKLYRDGKKEVARKEYTDMYNRVKSAVSANALGFLLVEDGKYGEAENFFREAIEINPSFAASKMNLGELAAKDNDFKQAVSWYRQAIKDDPERGLAYLRLGQLIVDGGGSIESAHQIWKEGLTATPDEEVLAKLRKAISESQ